ncbi:hypothetical protein HY638_04265 [Candidatus Woesearchaeota archaeon]|nr:hypothetical protein [Candidatus Woesearchaeota archaeon]
MAEQKASKIKKKVWFQIVASGHFNEYPIGETLVYEPREMLGKAVNVNLMVLTNDIKKQNINVTFKIDSIEGNRGKTSLVGYNLVPSSVKRLVRRNRDKMDLSFVCKTSDNILVRIKPLLITKGNAKGSVLSKIRTSCVGVCTRLVSKVNYNQFLDEILGHRLQENIIGELKKIYPLKTCEIRVMRIVPADKKVKVEKVVAQEEVPAEPAEPAEEPAVSV